MLKGMKRDLRSKREKARRDRRQLDPRRLSSVVGGVVRESDEQHTSEQFD